MQKWIVLTAAALLAQPISPAQSCAGAPDLRVLAINVADPPFRIFQNNNRVQVQVQNAPEAQSSAGSFFVAVDVCAVSAPVRCERLGTAVHNGADLAPGEAVTLPVNNAPTVPLPPGADYRIVATADNTGMVAECDERNNVASRPVTLSPHCPRVDFFNQFTRPEPYQPSVNRGSPVTVSFSYVNQGGRYEGRLVPVKLYLRPVQGSERLVPVAWRGRLDRRMATGAQKHFKAQRVRIPTGIEPGQYQWVAQADEDNEVLECDESNNSTPPGGPVFTVN